MKFRHNTIYIILTAILVFIPTLLFAEKLVIIHTNDTHSQILPIDDKDNLGGVARRMVLFDSIRSAERNVITIDAGDAVQGTLFFNLYGGEVEQKVMNALGYDIRILGNHEFDNGVDSLASILAYANSTFISSNYIIQQSELAGKFVKWKTYEIDGRRIDFIGINLCPEGMIAEGNYEGIDYIDAIDTANELASWLKNECNSDFVIAITHIGYNPSTPPGDLQLAQASDNIDIIIGGHSHDLINPIDGKLQWMIPNRTGHNVLITQSGKAGKYIGKIDIDLETLQLSSSVIRVDSRLDNQINSNIDNIIAPYIGGVDSIMNVAVGKSEIELAQDSQALLNWCTDVVLDRGRQMADSVDFAMFNKGGIRRGLPKGTVTEGQIMSMLPFSNYIQVIDIKGQDILLAMQQMARIGGNGVSDGVEIIFTPGSKELNYRDAEIVSVLINEEMLDPNRTYRVATIDYVANGGDYMSTMRNHELVAQSPFKTYDDVLNYLRNTYRDKVIAPSDKVRMHPFVNN